MNILRLLAALAALSLAAAAHAALPPGISGAWYNPAQRGHGLTVEILAPDRALVLWSVYDPDGRPLNLYMEGEIDGHRISGAAHSTHGPRFGEFRSENFELRPWGSLELRFANCNSAELRYEAGGDADGSRYGRGSIPLQRLTRLQSLPCRFEGDAVLPPGLYSGEIDRIDPVTRRVETRPVSAAVSPDGTLWALEALVSGTPLIPGGTYFFNAGPLPAAISAHVITASETAVQLEVTANSSSWLRGYPQTTRSSLTLHLTDDSVTGAANFPLGTGPQSLRLNRMNIAVDPLVRHLRVAELAGDYEVRTREQLFDDGSGYAQQLSIDATGKLCFGGTGDDCDWSGQLTIAVPGYAFVDFELRNPNRWPDKTFFGRGWLQPRADDPGRNELVLVGNAGDEIGLGLVARQR